MEYHYSDFVEFVNDQDPELAINHTGWCGCAIGDFVHANCDTREEDIVVQVLDMLFPPLYDADCYRPRVNDDIYEQLNNNDPETYGELADMIEAKERLLRRRS